MPGARRPVVQTDQPDPVVAECPNRDNVRMDPLKSNPENPRPPVVAGQQEGSTSGPRPRPSWNDWLASPAGQYVMRWETEQLSRLVVDMFGYFALQLGFLELDALQANRMPHRIRVSLSLIHI